MSVPTLVERLAGRLARDVAEIAALPPLGLFGRVVFSDRDVYPVDEAASSEDNFATAVHAFRDTRGEWHLDLLDFSLDDRGGWVPYEEGAHRVVLVDPGRIAGEVAVLHSRALMRFAELQRNYLEDRASAEAEDADRGAAA